MNFRIFLILALVGWIVVSYGTAILVSWNEFVQFLRAVVSSY